MSDSADRAQRLALLAGAALDVAFALPMLVAPEPAARLLRLDLPPDLTWFRLCAVLLLIAGGCYAVASGAEARTTRRIAIVGGTGRLFGCLVLVGSGLAIHAPALVAVGVLDGALGVAHLGLAIAARR